jgi:hypothetical protein
METTENITVQEPNKLTKFQNAISDNIQSIKDVGIVTGGVFSFVLVYNFTEALKDVFFLSNVFILVGAITTVNFAFTKLLKEKDRRELVLQFNAIKKDIIGGK